MKQYKHTVNTSTLGGVSSLLCVLVLWLDCSLTQLYQYKYIY